MKISIVRIGNSKGVILPKPIRELIGLSADSADLSVEGNSIIISPLKNRRRNSSPVQTRRKIKRPALSSGK